MWSYHWPCSWVLVWRRWSDWKESRRCNRAAAAAVAPAQGPPPADWCYSSDALACSSYCTGNITKKNQLLNISQMIQWQNWMQIFLTCSIWRRQNEVCSKMRETSPFWWETITIAQTHIKLCVLQDCWRAALSDFWIIFMLLSSSVLEHVTKIKQLSV